MTEQVRLVAAGVGVVAAACVVAGAAGVAVGFVHARSTPPLTAGTAVSAAPASAEQVRAATVQLCTGYASAYAALPDGQSSPADVIPAAAAISTALRENPAADPQIRAAVTDSVRLLQVEAAWLSQVPAQGAIRPAADPQNRQGRVADQHVWDLCRAY